MRHRGADADLSALLRERLSHVLAQGPSRARRAAGPAEAPRRRERPASADQPDSTGQPDSTDQPDSIAWLGATDESVGAEDLLISVDSDSPVPPRRFRTMHLGVLAFLLIIGLGVALWSVLSARPVALATPAPLPGPTAVKTDSAAAGTSPAAGSAPSPGFSGAGTPAGPTGSDSATPEPELIKIHVLGAVRHPGVVELPVGSRVQDALVEAGGLVAKGDAAELNLAQVLADGQQIIVGTKSQPRGDIRGQTESWTEQSGAEATAPIDLNTASAEQLDGLPGIGPVTVDKILAWRTEHGRFNAVEELQEVDGIGPKTFAELASHVRV